MHIRLGPLACLAAWLIAVAPGAYALLDAQQKPATESKPAAPAPPAPSADQQDQAALIQAVDALIGGTQPAPSGITVRWVGQHFIRSQGDSTYIPFTVNVDRAQLSNPMSAFYVRVVSKSAPAPAPAAAAGARPTYPWETTAAVEIPADGNVSRAIALPAGSYEAFVAVKERGAVAAPGAAPPKIGVVRHDLVVQPFTDTELTTSSIILARMLDTLSAPLPADKQQENPYVFGPLKVTPALDGMFATTSDLQVLFWIYGASQTGGKPDVQVEFSFHQKMPDGTAKYFNTTAPQDMNEKTLPPEFNMTAGHQLLSSLAIPLKSFPVGNYRLEIKVTDKPSGRSVTRDAEFTVSAS